MEKAAAGGRKRKIEERESVLAVSSVRLKTRRPLDDTALLQKSADSPESSGDSMCENGDSDHCLASCCSSNEWSDELVEGSSKFVDLEESAATVELFATSEADSKNCRDRRETTPSSTRPRGSNPRRRLQKVPSEAELEKFFAAAEKDLQEQFVAKYNYDIVKDEPMEGPYEWVEIQLKP